MHVTLIMDQVFVQGLNSKSIVSLCGTDIHVCTLCPPETVAMKVSTTSPVVLVYMYIGKAIFESVFVQLTGA